jgi:hypothetical protein
LFVVLVASGPDEEDDKIKSGTLLADPPDFYAT